MANDIITGSAVVAGIVAILFALRPYLLRKKEADSSNAEDKAPSVEDRAGFKSSDFWDKRFDKLEVAITTVDRIIREHRQINRDEMNELRDLLVEIDTGLKVAAATRKELR